MRSGNFWVGAREQGPYIDNNTPQAPVTPTAPQAPATPAATPPNNPFTPAQGNADSPFNTNNSPFESHTGVGEATNINPNWQNMRERYQNQFGNVPRGLRPMMFASRMMGGQPWDGNQMDGNQFGGYQNILANLLSRWGR